MLHRRPIHAWSGTHQRPWHVTSETYNAWSETHWRPRHASLETDMHDWRPIGDLNMLNWIDWSIHGIMDCLVLTVVLNDNYWIRSVSNGVLTGKYFLYVDNSIDFMDVGWNVNPFQSTLCRGQYSSQPSSHYSIIQCCWNRAESARLSSMIIPDRWQ